MKLDDAKKLYKSDEFKDIALKYFNEDELKKNILPEKWEDLDDLKGFWVKNGSNIRNADAYICEENKNVFLTKQQAKAAIALAQITQLLKVYHDGWVADWRNSSWKPAIRLFNKKIQITNCSSVVHLLSFETKEKRDHFLKHHIGLIKQSAPLLWGVVLEDDEKEDKEILREGYIIENENNKGWQLKDDCYLPLEDVINSALDTSDEREFYESFDDAKSDGWYSNEYDKAIHKITIYKDRTHKLEKVWTHN